MLVDPGALTETPRSWFVAVTMVVMVVATKFAAAWLAGWYYGYTADARRVMFGLSVVQAAATLAAVLVGFNLNIFDETVLNGAIAMILVTCPLGTWTVDRYGRRLAIAMPPPEASPVFAQRLLVPVANPAFATQLLDMAFLLRDPTIPGGIYPVSIVTDKKETDEAVARAEKLLSHCLAHAAGAGIPVYPSVRVDINVSDGIVRAAKELRAGVVVTGWGSDHSVRERIFGSVMENLLDTCPSRIMFCRLLQPLNAARRLFVLYPPMSTRRPDLNQLQQDIRLLSRQIGADVHAYIYAEGMTELRRTIESVRLAVPLTLIESQTLAEARSRLFRAIGEDDMIMLPGERASGALWSPSLDSLHELIASRFPSNNLIVVYPPLVASENVLMREPEVLPAQSYRIYPVDVDAGIGLEDLLRKMVTAASASHPALTAEACMLLRASALAYPMEVGPGILLIHAHCEHLEQPALLVATGYDTLHFPKVDATSRVLLALLSPKEQTPGRHLQLLASLARRFQHPGTIEAIGAAKSSEEICRIIEARTA
jgi:mannitol/fructose-specific phosphotransferase system IIA component (Ntr-type)/nucleotide-binding universal stress UspA family protein